MSTSWILHRIYSLDTSSLDFSHHLYCLIRHDQEDQYLTTLQGPQLARLVDFLDKVRVLPSAFYPVTRPILQALDAISAGDNLSRLCLHKLQAICGHCATLPSSYTISGKTARVGDRSLALGGIADLWEGIYRGKRVYIKTLKVPLNGDQTLKKVHVRCCTSLSHLLKNTYGPCSHFSKRLSSGKG